MTSQTNSVKTETTKTTKKDKVLYSFKSPAQEFKVFFECNYARVTQLKLNHGIVNTPVFMPVGTQGAIKGLTCSEMESIGFSIILSNTYHLSLRPGTDIISKLGGIHKFINWNNNILTDSGGFQMVSLLQLAEISEKGVKFQSPMDGTEMLLTPEKSIILQNEIGSDIIMALDDVVPATCNNKERFKEGCYRTIRWIDRCIKAHKKVNTQNLFGIIQGGLDFELRTYCLNEMIKRDKCLGGYAIGGLCGGEDKNEFWRIVSHCCKVLPSNKARYVMGVGMTLDILVCISLGCDMFDCVYPCRTGRFGTALVSFNGGELNLKNQIYKYDFNPIDNKCNCNTCKYYTRSYLHNIVSKYTTSSSLITLHNLTFMFNFIKSIQLSIKNNTFNQFVKVFMNKMFPKGINTYPKWTIDAFKTAGIIFK